MTSLGPVLEAAFAVTGIKKLNATAASRAQHAGSEGRPGQCEAAAYKLSSRRLRRRRS